MRTILRNRTLCIAATVLGATSAACGGGSGGATSGSFATTSNASVLVPSVTKVILKSTGGGFVVQPPAGAACDQQVWTYTLEIANGRLSWVRCDVTGTGSNASDYTAAAGSRVLAGPDLDSAKAAVRAVHVSTRMICGADKPNWTFEVASATSSLVYGDDFYACQMMFDHYVESDGLSALLGVLRPLAV